MQPDFLMITLTLFALGIAFAFLPAIVAYSKSHPRRLAIFVWCLALTFVSTVTNLATPDADQMKFASKETLTFVFAAAAINLVLWIALLVWACRKPKAVLCGPRRRKETDVLNYVTR